MLYEGVPRDGRTISPDGLAERVDALVRARRPEAARWTSSLPGSSTTGFAQLARDFIGPRAGRRRWRAWRCSTASPGRERHRFAPERHAEPTAPTLMLAGAESPSVCADAEAVAAGLPDARLTLLEGQRHGCLHRAPELFADTVLDFLGHSVRVRS